MLDRIVAALQKEGHQIIFDFHCHPAKNGVPGAVPSAPDINNAKGLPFERIVLTANKSPKKDYNPLVKRSAEIYRTINIPAPTFVWRVKRETLV